MKMILKDKRGQGLIELIIAVAVIVSGLFAVWTLFMSNFNGEQEAKARIIGANLAREGIEVVKNIRDSNWLHRDENINGENGMWQWNENLGAGTYVTDEIFSSDENYSGMPALASASDPEDFKLFIDSEGFFSHDPNGKQSAYSRKIMIKIICCNSDSGDPGDLEENKIRKQCSSQDFAVRDAQSCDDNETLIGIDVVSQADWTINGKARKITIQDQLFDWR